jgi:glycosyltransferase involved in cell wall biosynthesis
VADYIGLGDFGLAPYAPVPSRKHAAPIKVSEYWALGLPVIITSGIADDSEMIRTHGAGSVIGRPDKEEYARCIRETAALIEDNGTVKTYERIRPLAEKYRNFDIARSVYRSIYGNDR